MKARRKKATHLYNCFHSDVDPGSDDVCHELDGVGVEFDVFCGGVCAKSAGRVSLHHRGHHVLRVGARHSHDQVHARREARRATNVLLRGVRQEGGVPAQESARIRHPHQGQHLSGQRNLRLTAGVENL